ncbi:hypothetical protein [Streptomyces sp. F001]|uniref:hypothetical protein n=1 Tax=Streptomyces sp. F001 TaxID=1510026 RepID=UPI0013EE8AD2
MELARTGAEVTVFDTAPRVGGQAHLAALAPHRSGWQKLVDFQRDQLADLGVRVQLGTAATPAELAQYSEIVLATGAEEEVVRSRASFRRSPARTSSTGTPTSYRPRPGSPSSTTDSAGGRASAPSRARWRPARAKSP